MAPDIAHSALPPHKAALLQACLDANSLSFGTYTLKSGRISPYFFNAGALHQGSLLSTLAHAFAVTISAFPSASPATAPPPASDGGPAFDVLFGPAYKGIPLATATAVALHALDPARYAAVSYAFNRKTPKTYGDGGAIVGAPLAGRRVLVVDDVITAGTAVRDAFDVIRAQGGTVVGVVIALDRQEKAPPPSPAGAGVAADDDATPRMSAIGEVRRAYGVPVVAVLTLDDIIAGYRGIGTREDIERLEEYRERYRPME